MTIIIPQLIPPQTNNMVKPAILVSIPSNGSRCLKTIVEWYPTIYSHTNHNQMYMSHEKRALEVRKFMGLSEWTSSISFSIVRNPYERLVSVFLQNSGFLEGFPLFVQYLISGTLDPLVLKRTCKQLPNITNEQGEIIVSYVLKYEQLEQDFENLKTQLDLPSNVSILDVAQPIDYQSYYDDCTRALVEEYYKDDLKQFAYTF